jgi:hypothetical protein
VRTSDASFEQHDLGLLILGSVRLVVDSKVSPGAGSVAGEELVFFLHPVEPESVVTSPKLLRQATPMIRSSARLGPQATYRLPTKEPVQMFSYALGSKSWPCWGKYHSTARYMSLPLQVPRSKATMVADC